MRGTAGQQREVSPNIEKVPKGLNEPLPKAPSQARCSGQILRSEWQRSLKSSLEPNINQFDWSKNGAGFAIHPRI
jgi:hypothetical protein